ncbi:hypothetical protein DFH09DRAFT_1359699 [Mycena vulgaris]|nr:hypothetical protein DFH09DRAFT_1359699 [Mycena vulgaris]
MSTYIVNEYLLDRINIEDTINRMLMNEDSDGFLYQTWYVDRREWDKLSSLFTDKIVMDYTSLLGGELAHTTGAAQAQVWRGMLEYLDSSVRAIARVPQSLYTLDPELMGGNI